MEEDEVVLSDVHMCLPSSSCGDSHTSNLGYNVIVSRFVFLRNGYVENPADKEAICTEEDDDGDLVVVRREEHIEKDVIYIEHTKETKLKDVGLQVWQGCLLLCDYILDNLSHFEGLDVLELGGGVGLTSIVMAMAAKTVWCTDIGAEVLEVCKRNASNNQDLCHGNVEVRELNWLQGQCHEESAKDYGFSPIDLDQLKKVKVIIAADVIYDTHLTDGFINTVLKLMAEAPQKILYVALEKRLNFTVDVMDVSCPAYQHFRHHLEQLSLKQEPSYSVEQLPVSFPQYFEYTRNKYLELWRIKSLFEND